MGEEETVTIKAMHEKCCQLEEELKQEREKNCKEKETEKEHEKAVTESK